MLYMIKAGANDGVLPLPNIAANAKAKVAANTSTRVPVVVHAVFDMREPHGDVYAGVSDYLARYHEQHAHHPRYRHHHQQRQHEADGEGQGEGKGEGQQQGGAGGGAGRKLLAVPHIVKPPVGCVCTATANTTANATSTSANASTSALTADDGGDGDGDDDGDGDLFDQDSEDQDEDQGQGQEHHEGHDAGQDGSGIDQFRHVKVVVTLVAQEGRTLYIYIFKLARG